MAFKKIGMISGIPNKTLFLAVPSKNLIIVDNALQKKQSEWLFYKDFKIVKRFQWETLGILSPFTHQNEALFATEEKVIRLDMDSYQQNPSLKGFLVAKIGQDLYIDGKIQRFDGTKIIELEKSLYLNPLFYAFLPKHGFIYGYTQMGQYDADKTFIACFSAKTGKELWHYSSHFFGLQSDIYGGNLKAVEIHFIGNTKHQLWLSLTNGPIVVLNIETGALLAVIGQAEGNKESLNVRATHSRIGSAGAIEGQKVIFLGHHFYQEMSMRTFKIKIVDLQTVLEPYGLSIGQVCMDKNYIYFTDSHWIGSRPCGKVAVLDRKTLKIVWHWDMLSEIGVTPLHIGVIEEQFHVLDTDGTLHVFASNT